MHEIIEDQEALGVLACLDERLNLEQPEVNGKKSTIIIHQAYGSRYLFEIDSFVKDIGDSWEGGFIDEINHYAQVETIRALYLGEQYYRRINDWLGRHSGIHRYSTRVEAFYDVCKEQGLIGESTVWFGEPGVISNANGTRYMDVFNVLIDTIRNRCKTREFKERERLRLANAERNMRNVLAMDEAMFSVEAGRSRWLLLSLTLRYKSEFRDSITPEMIQQHRERFFKARRFNKLMSGIRNFVWAIEEGENTGLHLHVILFYSADHNHDEFIAQQLGEYWVEVVTEGKGDYWNSNAGRLKKIYETRGHGVGVGQINWNDVGKRDALRKNLVYLAKAAQYLMIKGAENMHTFDMGQLPKKVKAGRPRSDADVGGNSIDVESFYEADITATLLNEVDDD